jgi:hypothetical protein
MERVSGVLIFIKVYNGNWGLGSIELSGGDRLPCIGTKLIGLKKGKLYQFHGQIKDHETYGRQFEVSGVEGGPAGSKTKATRRAKPVSASSSSSKPARSAKKFTKGRKRFSRKAVYVPDGFVDRYSGPSTLQLHRITNAAYEFGSSIHGTRGATTHEELVEVIYSYLCETLAWKELGEPCRMQATEAARKIIGHYKKLAPAVGPAIRYEDIQLILWYEAAHHIGIEYRSQGRDQGREVFIDLVSADLVKHSSSRNAPCPADIARKAALHAENELL